MYVCQYVFVEDHRGKHICGARWAGSVPNSMNLDLCSSQGAIGEIHTMYSGFALTCDHQLEGVTLVHCRLDFALAWCTEVDPKFDEKLVRSAAWMFTCNTHGVSPLCEKSPSLEVTEIQGRLVRAPILNGGAPLNLTGLRVCGFNVEPNASGRFFWKRY